MAFFVEATMPHTKPQERLVRSMKAGQKVQYLIGGGGGSWMEQQSIRAPFSH
ncbi:hypothetical protein GCM10008997_15470 [Halomonas salifodinae]